MKWSSVRPGADVQQAPSSAMVDAGDVAEASFIRDTYAFLQKIGWAKVALYSVLTLTCDSLQVESSVNAT